MRRSLRLRPIVVATVLAALELTHPAWSSGTVAQSVLDNGGWWVLLHVLLMAGYGGLVYLLWVPGALLRILLLVFLVCNTVFLGVDGIGVGLLAATDPSAADLLWNSPVVAALANITGAAWAASLLGVARSLVDVRVTRNRPVVIGLSLTWLTFVASAPPLEFPALVSRLAAVATGAWVVYGTGAAGIPFALLVFAAVLHQHVGAEAALGLVLVGVALARLPEHG